MTSDTNSRIIDHWLFAGVSEEVTAPLYAVGRVDRFYPGEVIFREGDEADGLYLITAGSVRVAATNESGETSLAVIHAGDVLGEMGVLDGLPRSGTASSVGLCETFFLPTEPFLDLLEQSTPVCLRLLALLTTRLRRANGRLGEIAATASFQTENVAY